MAKKGKTIRQMSRYLPSPIGDYLVYECEKAKTNVDVVVAASLHTILTWQAISFDWRKSELGADFWAGISLLLFDYQGREQDITKDYDFLDEAKEDNVFLLEQIKELEQKNNLLNSELEPLKEQIKELEQNNNQLSSEIEILKEEKIKSDASLESALQYIDDLEENLIQKEWEGRTITKDYILEPGVDIKPYKQESSIWSKIKDFFL